MAGRSSRFLAAKTAMAREPRVRIPLTESVATISRLERRDDVKKAHEPTRRAE